MISRRSLFGFALVPLADDKSAPKIYDAKDFVSVVPALDFKDCYTYQAEVIFARAVRRVQLGEIEYEKKLT